MKRRWLQAGVLALALVLLAAWLWRAAPSRIAAIDQLPALLWSRLAAWPWWAWPAVLLGTAMLQALRAERVYLEWRDRCGLSRWDASLLVARHYAGLNVLPMRSGEALFPWLMWREYRVPLTQSATSLLAWRVQDALVLAGLILSMLSWVRPERGLPWLAAAALVSLALIGLSVLLRTRWRGTPAVGVPRRWRAALAHAGAGARGWLLSVALWSSKAALWATVMCALVPGGWLEAAHGWQPALAGALAGECAAALPGQPLAGWGTYEAGAWLGWQWSLGDEQHSNAAAVLGAAAVAHALSVACALLLGLIAHTLRQRRPALVLPHTQTAGQG